MMLPLSRRIFNKFVCSLPFLNLTSGITSHKIAFIGKNKIYIEPEQLNPVTAQYIKDYLQSDSSINWILSIKNNALAIRKHFPKADGKYISFIRNEVIGEINGLEDLLKDERNHYLSACYLMDELPID